MNKPPKQFVSFSVRAVLLVFIACSTVFWVGCSGSRTVGTDLVVPGGRSVSKTVTGSDVFIASGSELEVDYSSRNRFFVASGGALVGFSKGVNQSKIYAEEGAVIPDSRRLRGFTVITVKDAGTAYRDRYKELLPAEVQAGIGNQSAVVPVVGVGAGVGFWGGGWGGWGWGRNFGGGRGFSRPASVRASSYQRKN